MTNCKAFEILLLLCCIFSSTRMSLLRQSKAFDGSIQNVHGSKYLAANYPMDRKLIDDVINVNNAQYRYKGPDSKLQKQLRLFKLANSIKRKAKRRGLRIKKVSLGHNVKNIVGDRNISKHLSDYLEDKNLKSRILKLSRRLKTKDKYTGNKGAITPNNKKLETPKGALPSPTLKKHRRHLNNELAKFDYLPGPAGPFGGIPPMMMNPIHMHPPLNITVNRVPDKSYSKHIHPLELQKIDLNGHKEQLNELKNELNKARDEAEQVSNNMDKSVVEDMNLFRMMKQNAESRFRSKLESLKSKQTH